MNADVVIDIGQQALRVIALVSGPPLLFALLVGLVIGMFQAATQINEATLSFIPKLAALAAVLAFAGGWMLEVLTSYTMRLYASIPGLIG